MPRAPRERCRGDRRAPFLLVSLLLLALLTGPVSASLGVGPGRFDLGHLARGEVATAVVTYRNGGTSALDVVTRSENLDGATLTADPASFSLVSGGEQQVLLRLQVATTAAPGRFAPTFIATSYADSAGNQALGAVQVQFVYVVAAADIAYLEVLDNGTVFVRFVNGHDTMRTVTLTLTMQGQGISETTTRDFSVAAGANQLIYWPLVESYPNGTYSLRANGTASGAPSPEAFSKTYTLTRDGAGFHTTIPTGATGGGNGGAGDAGPPTPAAPGGGGGDAPRDPIEVRPVISVEERPVRGAPPAEAPREPVQVLPVGLRTLLDGVTYSLVAMALALVAGIAVFLARSQLRRTL